jgi:hypothetical protein
MSPTYRRINSFARYNMTKNLRVDHVITFSFVKILGNPREVEGVGTIVPGAASSFAKNSSTDRD